MHYTVQQLASLAGVTVRTIHYYHELGLLYPAYTKQNGYRFYGEKELLRLQQIMLFRELEFPLEDIKRILNNPAFDTLSALQKHRVTLVQKVDRLHTVLSTIDNTITKLTTHNDMKDKDLYTGLSKQEQEAYALEAKERWGDTEAYKQSAGKYERLTSEEKKAFHEQGANLMKEIVLHMHEGAESDSVQALIEKHYNGLRFFYEPTLELYRNLGIMYISDERFNAYFSAFHPDLAKFMHDAMHVYCASKE